MENLSAPSQLRLRVRLNAIFIFSITLFKPSGKALTLALQTLAEQYVAGEDVTIDDVEQAICDYAKEHPKSIRIASKSGYNEVFLTGEWPSTITLNAQIVCHSYETEYLIKTE